MAETVARRVARGNVGKGYLAAIVSFFCGFLAASSLFSDMPRGATELDLILRSAVYHAVPAFIVGVLFPSRWYIGILCAWYALSLGIAGFPLLLFTGEPSRGLDHSFLIVAGSVAVTVGGAWAGSRLRKAVAFRRRGQGL